jgi:hypothetical protein
MDTKLRKNGAIQKPMELLNQAGSNSNRKLQTA